MNDGWKFAESLLGITAEALKARREAEEKATLTTAIKTAQQEAATKFHDAAMRQCAQSDSSADSQEGFQRCMATWQGERPGSPPAPNEDVGPNSARWAKIWADEVARRKGPTNAPPAHSTEERRVRQEIASKLSAILFPTGRAGFGGDGLEHALNEVSALVHFTREEGAKVTGIRDAALEDAAALFDGFARDAMANAPPETRHLARDKMQAHARSIRALKSKPAITYDPVTDSYTGPCAVGDTYVKPEAATAERKGVRRLGRCPTCGEDMLHAAGCSMGEAENPSQPWPIHDFGWALARMREGKKVRRPSCGLLGDGDIIKPIRFSFNDAILHDDDSPARLDHSSIRATDWRVVE